MGVGSADNVLRLSQSRVLTPQGQARDCLSSEDKAVTPLFLGESSPITLGRHWNNCGKGLPT